MGMPCESSYYESRPKASADLDKAEQVAATAHEEEQAFLAEMLADFREDALRSAARTEGIDRKFWLTVAEKVA
ncbi:hypothetical protein ACTXO6_03290 [Corynebacterium variabile]|uniref:hypothetical protein n=1 Tax=Corynebacterium variabile TaxID=1727 RepID=UPI003FCF7D0A